ncbi:MAG: DUF3570 domain-containing protein, partial [Planctomycetota bacterium]|nr:DUF3570 domain-containing protein [Planctomycetota bacterium]
EWDWSFRPGFFHHHQLDNQSLGLDLAFARDFDGGNTSLSITYSYRYDNLLLLYWDGSDRGTDSRTTHNILFGWTQLVTPRLKSYLGLQLTRQDGILIETYNFVTLVDGTGVPRMFIDEVLPDNRNRVQANGRLRYTTEPGKSVGLDASLYYDDWGVLHGSIEPSYETTFPGERRLRVWYRFSAQDGTKYFTKQSQVATRFRTQDSDLDSFSMHSPGTTFSFPIKIGDSDRNYRMRISVFGFWRDDGISGFGTKIGLVRTW